MKNIIKTTLLEFAKSAFLIDLVKHSSGNMYIEITQTIDHEANANQRTIKLNPSVVSDLIRVLENYLEKFPTQNPFKAIF